MQRYQYLSIQLTNPAAGHQLWAVRIQLPVACRRTNSMTASYRLILTQQTSGAAVLVMNLTPTQGGTHLEAFAPGLIQKARFKRCGVAG